jgi:CCR4-NOT transcription complex subunit 1
MHLQLVESNGSEVYTKYIRRLVQSNQSTIFSNNNRPADGTYQALLDEIRRCNSDPEYAYKIAEALDTTEGDLFRDFDLSTFLNHFDLNPLSKTSLALAFKNASKVDLRTKGR